jgi:superfamily II DNA or RNA helicase
MNKREKIQKEGTQAILNNKFSGIVHCSPRLGKSKLVIDALNTKEIELNVLITAPSIPVFESWKKEIVTWDLKENVNVDYCWSNSLKKVKKDYHLIIADECHEYNLKVLTQLKKQQNKGTKVLGLTGTLDEESRINLQKILGLEVVYEYSFEQAIKDKIIADYQITCISCELDDTEKYILAGSKEKPFYQTELQSYSYWDNRYNIDLQNRMFSSLKFIISKRSNIIYNSISKLKKTQELVAKSKRCLIFTGRQEIADQIGEASFHSKSKVDSLDLFKTGEINKLSVINMVSVGQTIPNLKECIFNQLQSVETTAIQKSMRSMNLESNKKAKIKVLYLKGTQDEIWIKKALKGFEQNKIKWL